MRAYVGIRPEPACRYRLARAIRLIVVPFANRAILISEGIHVHIWAELSCGARATRPCEGLTSSRQLAQKRLFQLRVRRLPYK